MRPSLADRLRGLAQQARRRPGASDLGETLLDHALRRTLRWLAAADAAEAEVAELRDALLGEADVARLHVAREAAGPVCAGERGARRLETERLAGPRGSTRGGLGASWPDARLEDLAAARALRCGVFLAALQAARARRRAQAKVVEPDPGAAAEGALAPPGPGPLERMRTYEELREQLLAPTLDPRQPRRE